MALQDFFINDGKTRPWYGQLAYPAAMHVSGTNATWFAWESYFSGDRAIRVTTHDFDTGAWTADVLVSTHTLSNDDHGVPALCRDADGYVHCFGGAHDSLTLKEWVTNAADNPAAWTLRTTFSSDILSYPRPVLVGSTMYLFVREQDTPATKRRLAIYVTSGISGGVPTWGSLQRLVDFGADSRVYTSTPIVSGTDIHLSATRSNYTDSVRQHQYYFIYDTTNGSIRNADGSVTVTSGSLPIDSTTANTSFRMVTSGSGVTSDVAAHCLDASGDPHICYLERSGGVTTVKHITHDGSSWSSPVTVVTLADDVTRYSSCLLPQTDGSVELWHDEDAAKAWVSGGNIQRIIRSSGGVWGSPLTILTATDYALGNPSVVRSGAANARVVFAELTVGDSDSSGGNLRGWAYGAAGFLQRDFGIGPIPPVTEADPSWANVVLLLQGRP